MYMQTLYAAAVAQFCVNNSGGGTTFRRDADNFGGGYKLLYPTLLSLGGTIPPVPPGIAPMYSRVLISHRSCAYYTRYLVILLNFYCYIILYNNNN